MGEALYDLTFCWVNLYVTPRSFRIEMIGSKPMVSLSSIWTSSNISLCSDLVHLSEKSRPETKLSKPGLRNCCEEDCSTTLDSPVDKEQN